MFQVVRQLKSKDKTKILVNSEDGVTASEKKQVQIVTEYFKFLEKNQKRMWKT